MEDVEDTGACVQGARVTWELAVLLAPFFYKSKIINLKNRFKKKRKAEGQRWKKSGTLFCKLP